MFDARARHCLATVGVFVLCVAYTVAPLLHAVVDHGIRGSVHERSGGHGRGPHRHGAHAQGHSHALAHVHVGEADHTHAHAAVEHGDDGTAPVSLTGRAPSHSHSHAAYDPAHLATLTVASVVQVALEPPDRVEDIRPARQERSSRARARQSPQMSQGP